MRFTSALGIAAIGLITLNSVAREGLVGSSVTGSLRFVGAKNYFDPANGFVPSGVGNTTSTTVTITAAQTEFGYQDGFSRITADFTNTRLTITETPFVTDEATIERYGFSNSAFVDLAAVVVSNSYPVSPTVSLAGDNLTISLAGHPVASGSSTALTLALTLFGDATLNGTVDFNDFLALQNNFGQLNTRFDQGNFNADGQTDFDDFLLLQNNFGQSMNGTPAAINTSQAAAMTAFAQTQAVPEPGMLAMIGLVALGLGRRRSPGDALLPSHSGGIPDAHGAAARIAARIRHNCESL